MADIKRVGFVGVGVMGRPMARRLIEAGYTLTVFDQDKAAMNALGEIGAKLAGSVKELADGCEIVFTSLPTPAVFKEVVLGAGGIGEGQAIQILVDLSTVGSQTERQVARALVEKEIETVDAPVSGGAAGAQKGSLAIMAAGKADAINQVRPLFEVLGKLFVVGDEPGQAQLIKLLNNMLSSTAMAITSEAYVAGLKGGLSPEVMMSVFNAGSGKSGATMDKFPKHILPGTFDFGFPVGSVCKDIGLAIEECQALGVPMWLGNSSRQLWNNAAAQGGRGSDMTEIVHFVEQWSSGEKVLPQKND